VKFYCKLCGQQGNTTVVMMAREARWDMWCIPVTLRMTSNDAAAHRTGIQRTQWIYARVMHSN